MTAPTRIQGPILKLTDIKPDPDLVRLIPEQAERRFHILPVAREGGRVTVAMADPDDPNAQQIVHAAFGKAAYVVRCDRSSIDRLLNGLGSEAPQKTRRILVGHPWGPVEAPFKEYAERIGEMLHGELSWPKATQRNGGGPDGLAQAFGNGWDLIICSVPDVELRPSVSRAARAYRLARKSHSALLLVRRPRWPLRQILFLVRGAATDLNGLHWVRHFARPQETAVTVLTVVLPVPAMYGGLRRMQVDVLEVLSTRSKLGIHLREIAQGLTDWQIEAHLRILQGAPTWQLREELAEGDYDLLVVCGEPARGVARFLEPDLAESAISVAPIPILIVAGRGAEVDAGHES